MHLIAFLKSPRFWGIGGLSLLAYIVVIGMFGNVDISGYLPIKLATSIQTHWPDLPFFTVEKDSINDGKQQEVYYTVPTRQFTAKEIAQLQAQGKKPRTTAQPTPSSAAK